MTYRPDIDGLRAVAVLAVVLFHLGIPGTEGGFVGVDVFFVISGFLITSIIKRSIEQGRFVLREFYFRRIRRLVPALVATVVATIAASAAVLTPEDMARLARSGVAALFSVSNLVFYAEAGYWDTASELKPLLHTWSLGVEEQFYLFWPALVAGLMAVSGRVPLWMAFLLVSVAGAALCVGYTGVDPSAAFYLLPFRVFQFALGALVIPLITACGTARWARRPVFIEALFIGGMGLVIGSVVLLDGASGFPGWVVLAPTLGAVLLLVVGGLASGRRDHHRRLLENRASIWIGRVSYSMYLVHWPIVSLYRYHQGTELHLQQQLWLALAILAATVLLHHGVERRFYHRSGEGAWAAIGGARFALRTLGAVSLAAGIAATAWLGDGWSWRYQQLSLTTAEIEQGKRDRLRPLSSACFVHYPPGHPNCDRPHARRLLVLGNSHEPDGFNFARAALADRPDVQLLNFGTINGCQALEPSGNGFSSSSAGCQRRLDALFDEHLLNSLDAVLYAANQPFTANKASLLAMLEKMRAIKPGLRIAILGGYINTERGCSQYIVQSGNTRSCARQEHVTYFEDQPGRHQLHAEFMALADLYIDRVGLLCRERRLETCLTETPDGVPAFYDAHHHSRAFAEYSGRLFAERNPGWFEALFNAR